MKTVLLIHPKQEDVPLRSRDYCKKPIRTLLGLTRRRPIMYMARITRG